MPFDPLTIIFAVVAILVVWKLNNVLGQSGGFQRQQPPVRPDARPGGRFANRDGGRDAEPSNVVRLPGTAAAPDPARWTPFLDGAGGNAAVPGLDAVAGADPAFAAAPFLDGARTAYEAIITAFAAGERRTLQNLLAPDVYDGFNAAILDREKRRETLSTTLVSEPEPKFRSATLDGRTARVAVRFLSKQISATHGPDGALRDGSPDSVLDVDDIWTFTRDVSARDPNWKLVATESGH